MAGALALHRPGDSALHRLAPQVKIVAAFSVVLGVVATPRTWLPVFAAVLVALPVVWAIAGIPAGWFARRALMESPFIVLALALPFVGTGPRADFLGMSVSVEGSLAGWNIFIKGTIGVLVALTIVATTHPTELLAGLRRLRAPRMLITIAGLMLRYVELLVAEGRRMHVARLCRGHDPRFLWQAAATARGIGTLFIRAYERGERVHQAMLARGEGAAMPESDAARPAPALLVNGLRYSYPDGHRALDGIDLRIEHGERVAVLGPNGAGKTTFALQLNGVLAAEEGSIEVAGLPVTSANLHEIRRRVGLVFQDADDQLFMPTVADDVGFGPRNFSPSARVDTDDVRARVHTALTEVGMREHAGRSPMHLSEGQRRRVALAAVLACRPEILVLDEPSANLEPVARRELAELLLTMDRTMLVITHDLPYALQLCPRAVLVDGGRVVADRSTRDLLADTELLARHRLELPWGFRLD